MTSPISVELGLRRVTLLTPKEDILTKASRMNPLPEKAVDGFEYYLCDYHDTHGGMVRYQDGTIYPARIPLTDNGRTTIQVQPVDKLPSDYNEENWLSGKPLFENHLSRLVVGAEEKYLTANNGTTINEDGWSEARRMYELKHGAFRFDESKWKEKLDPENVYWAMMNTAFSWSQNWQWRGALGETQWVTNLTTDSFIHNETSRIRSIGDVPRSLDLLLLGFRVPLRELSGDAMDTAVSSHLESVMQETIYIQALQYAKEVDFAGSRVAQAHLSNEAFRHSDEKIHAMRSLQSRYGENKEFKMTDYWHMALDGWKDVLSPEFFAKVIQEPIL